MFITTALLSASSRPCVCRPRYRTSDSVILHPKDQLLLQDEGGDSDLAERRIANMQKSVPWLVRPDYISSETKAYE